MKKIITLLFIISACSIPILGMEPAAKIKDKQDFSHIATSLVDQTPDGPLPTEISKHIQSYCQLPLEVDWFFSHGWTFNKDKSIATFLNNNTLKIYNFSTKKVKVKDNVRSFKFSPDNQQIFILFWDMTTELIDLKSNHVVLKKQDIRFQLLSSDNQKIFIQFCDNTSELIDLKSNQTVLTKQNVLDCCQFSPDSQKVFIRFDNGTAEMIDLRSNQVILTKQNVSCGSKFSPDSQKIFIEFKDHTGELIDLKSSQTTQKQNVLSYQFSPDSQQVFIRFYNFTAELINLKSNQTTQKQNTCDYEFSPDGQHICITFKDWAVDLIDLTSNQTILTKQNVSFFQFIPDSQKIFIRFSDNTTELIDLTLNQTTLTKQNVSNFQLSPNGQKIFIQFIDYTAELIDLRSGTIIKSKNAKMSDLIKHTQKLENLTITQALYLQELHDRLANQKSCNSNEHGTLIYNSFPAYIQLLIDEKISSVHSNLTPHIPQVNPKSECFICLQEASEIDEKDIFVTSCCKQFLCHLCFLQNLNIGTNKETCPQRCNGKLKLIKAVLSKKSLPNELNNKN